MTARLLTDVATDTPHLAGVARRVASRVRHRARNAK
jgi:hypothetical protein